MTIAILFKISLTIFIAGNLLDMGLRLNHQQALRGLKDLRFVGHAWFWGFVVGPALAYTITIILPLEYPFGIGLILLGMTPGVPFMPMVVHRVRGDLGYTAAFMLLASVTTVIYMPFVVPFLLEGLTVSAWTIAKPLLVVMFLPLMMGMLIHRFSVALAYRASPVVKKITMLFTVVACVLAVVVYGKGVHGINVSWAIVSLIVFFFVMTAFPYWFGFGLGHDQKIILSIGMSTRNLGASLAPLLSVPTIDERAIIMIGLGLPAMLFFAWMATRWFGHSIVTDNVSLTPTKSK